VVLIMHAICKKQSQSLSAFRLEHQWTDHLDLVGQPLSIVCGKKTGVLIAKKQMTDLLDCDEIVNMDEYTLDARSKETMLRG
jgi:hypothetical protein